jgi:hypothetical protein
MQWPSLLVGLRQRQFSYNNIEAFNDQVLFFLRLELTTMFAEAMEKRHNLLTEKHIDCNSCQGKIWFISNYDCYGALGIKNDIKAFLKNIVPFFSIVVCELFCFVDEDFLKVVKYTRININTLFLLIQSMAAYFLFPTPKQLKKVKFTGKCECGVALNEADAESIVHVYIDFAIKMGWIPKMPIGTKTGCCPKRRPLQFELLIKYFRVIF